nr:hypothetical protein [Abalone asfa-like virus]
MTGIGKLIFSCSTIYWAMIQFNPPVPTFTLDKNLFIEFTIFRVFKLPSFYYVQQNDKLFLIIYPQLHNLNVELTFEPILLDEQIYGDDCTTHSSRRNAAQTLQDIKLRFNRPPILPFDPYHVFANLSLALDVQKLFYDKYTTLDFVRHVSATNG